MDSTSNPHNHTVDTKIGNEKETGMDMFQNPERIY
jgi:hypothetical protein